MSSRDEDQWLGWCFQPLGPLLDRIESNLFFWIAGDRAALRLGHRWCRHAHRDRLLVVNEGCAAHRVIVHDQAVNGAALRKDVTQ